jgi:hypothetical protein
MESSGAKAGPAAQTCQKQISSKSIQWIGSEAFKGSVSDRADSADSKIKGLINLTFCVT